ncbi:ADP-ribose glycohydrolase OARD1 isoform X2 [Nematostella vectensis]|uniref:ADP-ribose glycohydrolase OARD1 isoform X2 n=1 Tax=Nematostella vectensis TaxID=45351 RepID=UPI0013902BD3|nr:ADP-ribose glycohydrolase OARD1 isoform X2 [Nematostella vectensis]
MAVARRVAKSRLFEVQNIRNALSVWSRFLSTNPVKGMCKVEELRGRPWVLLASAPEVSLACAVSRDFEMHKGIAKEFKRTFGDITSLKEQKKSVGDIAVLRRNENSFVYYLVTRDRWWDKATHESFFSSITAMRDHCVENGVTKLTLPRLGSAEDWLGWDAVRDIITEVFADTGVSLTAYSSR